MQVLNPTHEADSPDFALAKRLTGLRGKTVGIISNNKKGTKPFFAAIEKELMETYGVARVVRRAKSNYSAPADAAIMEEARSWDAIISGVGD